MRSHSSRAALAALGVLALGHPAADRGATRTVERSAGCESDDLAAVADSVAAAFHSARFVFLGSTHGGSKIHRLLVCLISRPEFQDAVTDIIVEWANPVHQRLLDRYLVELEDLPVRALRPAALDTWVPRLWATLPQLPEFYEAVRAANTGRPLANRLRVLGGNSPVDWTAVRTAEDMARRPPKTNYTAHIITEHLWPHPQVRALVVYGVGHIHRSGGGLMADLLATIPQSEMFVVGDIDQLRPGERDVVSTLGNPDMPFFARAARAGALSPVPYDLFYAREGPLEQYVDAVAYLGPDPNRSLAGTIEFTEAERTEVSRRASFLRDPDWFEYLRRHRDTWFGEHPLLLAPDPRG